MFKKILKLVAASVIASLLFATTVLAGPTSPGASTPTTPGALCLTGTNTWIFCNTASTFGNTSSRIAEGWFTKVDTTTLVLGGAVTGPILNTNGTAAAPSYSFASDPDTGLYSSAANTLGFTAAGVSLGTWTTNLLSVVGSATNAGNIIQIANTNAGAAAQATFKSTTDAGDFYFGNASIASTAFSGAGFVYTASARAFQIWTNNVQRLTASAAGDLTFNSVGGNFIIGNGAASGKGNIQLQNTSNASYDTNLLYLSDNAMTMGMIASVTPAFGAVNGPFVAMRGNAYTAIATQRGILTLSAGSPTTPAAGEGEIRFSTATDVRRMTIDKDGLITSVNTLIGGQIGFSVQETGSGVSAAVTAAGKFSLLAGYTGTAGSFGVYAQNQSAGTASNEFSNVQAANYGEYIATTTGTIVGQAGYASGGDRNYGGFFRAIVDKAAAVNVGVGGFASISTGTAAVGGFFGLMSATPTYTTAALIADNGAIAAPVFIARDNGTKVFSIADGGKVGVGNITPSAIFGNTATNAVAYDGTGVDLTNGLLWSGNSAGYQLSFTQAGTGTARNGMLVNTSSTAVDSSALTVANTTFGMLVVRSDGHVGMGVTNTTYADITSTLTILQRVSTSGSPTLATFTGAAHTGLTAATEDIGANFNFSATKTWAAGAGPLALQREILVQAPTYAGDVGTPLTMTNVATLAVSGAPIQGANTTLTNKYALLVQTGTLAIGVPGTGAGVGTAGAIRIYDDNGRFAVYNSAGSIQGAFGLASGSMFIGNATTQILTIAQTTGTTTISPGAGGGLILSPAAGTSGSPTLLTVTAPAHTTLAKNTEAIDLNFNLARTVQFATVDTSFFQQRAVLFQPPIYAFVGSSTITAAVNVSINGGPTAGANAIFTNSFALGVQGWSGNAATNTTIAVEPPGLANGFGNATELTGITYTKGIAVGLGDQTANLTNIYGIKLDAITYTSTTLTRTVTGNVASMYIAGAPIASTNVTFTNTAGITLNSFWVASGSSRFGGRVLEAKGADVASANTVTLGADGNTFTITGVTTVNGIITSGWTVGSKITLIFSGALTVTHNSGTPGAGASPILLAGSVNLTTAANTVLTLIYDGTNWQELSRKAA